MVNSCLSLDIYEVPESHTGETLARAFDEMLARFGIEAKNTALDVSPNNNFESENHVRCFNHSLNLAAKVFLRPFDPAPKKKSGDDAAGTSPEDIIDMSDPDLVLEEDLDELPDLVAVLDSEDAESESDEEDAVWDELMAEERQSLLGQAQAVKLIISRVRQFSFAVVNSTKGSPSMATRWNSVYDMLAVAIEYKAVFNDMTVNRDLDYRKFDISNAE
ncbi:hypothetical protein B0H10DRAFT_2223745 [Mycena sp. CBHHK59/15]|nr:hypothetical protein B0H10DRAFT_2223745 [Mycena sp. CBHHK59/15]